jgi:hypothetical protein
MERHDDKHEHPARPEQTGDDDGFAEGVDHKPDSPEEELEPNFARGVSYEDTPDAGRRPRFSEGIEELPDTPDKTAEGRFSEGIEEDPDRE